MKWGRLVYGWLGYCAAVLAMPEEAYACQYGTNFSIEEVRANGLVHLKWYCQATYCDKKVPDPLRIADAATMEEVAGSIVWLYGERTQHIDVFWKPAEPLVAGNTYRVLDLEWATNSDVTTFTVLPAATWASTDALELKTGLESTEDRSAGEITCPARYPVMRCGPDAPPSPRDATVYTRHRTSLWISAYAFSSSGSLPPLKRRTVYWRDGDAPVDVASKPWSITEREEQITEGAARYCYLAAVQNLLDGSERQWEGCLDHGDLPELTTREASREEIAPDTERCAEPPEGYEAEWCERSMTACAREYSSPPASDCENVAKRCAPPAEDDDAGAPEDDAGEPKKPRKRTSSDGGCSVPSEPNGDSSPLMLLATVLAAAALRRRKRA